MSASELDGERGRKSTQTHPKGHQSNLCFTASQSSVSALICRSRLFELELSQLCASLRCSQLP